ncbi:MAG: hypothetical protein AAFY21_21220 [Cyanobacteria bacterium J06641_2]
MCEGVSGCPFNWAYGNSSLGSSTRIVLAQQAISDFSPEHIAALPPHHPRNRNQHP